MEDEVETMEIHCLTDAVVDVAVDYGGCTDSETVYKPAADDDDVSVFETLLHRDYCLCLHTVTFSADDYDAVAHSHWANTTSSSAVGSSVDGFANASAASFARGSVDDCPGDAAVDDGASDPPNKNRFYEIHPMIRSHCRGSMRRFLLLRCGAGCLASLLLK